MSKQKLTAEQIVQIEKILNEGGTKVSAAERVLGSRTRESSIRSAIQRGAISLNSAEDAEVDKTLTEVQLEELCVSNDWSVANLAKRLRSSQRTNNQLRKVQREMFDGGEEGVVSLGDIVSEAAKSIADKMEYIYHYVPSSQSEPATLEVLFSDLQIGKVSRYYNTAIAKEAMKLYGEGIIEAIEDRRSKYKVERIVFAMIGDVCEDNTKHGVGSAISCDTGLSEQMHDAIEGVWSSILSPLAVLRIPMDVICIVGNHASSTHKGMGTFKEGKFSYDYVVHKTLESFCKLKEYTWVNFDIPEGTFGTLEIYGKHAIYEHGYHNPYSEKGMVDQMRKRGAQLQIHPTYWRQGDKHHSTVFGQGEQVLNAAFFGVDQEGLEYSGVLGFNSVPSQTIMFHVDEKVLGRGNVKDIVNIQLAITDNPVK